MLSDRSVPLITLASLSAGFLVHRSHEQYLDRHGLAEASPVRALFIKVQESQGMEVESKGGDDGSGRQRCGIVILSLSCRCRRFAGGSKGVSGRQRREAEAKGQSGRSKQRAEAKRPKQKAEAKGKREGSSEAEAEAEVAECSMFDRISNHSSIARCPSIARNFGFYFIPSMNSKLSSVRDCKF